MALNRHAKESVIKMQGLHPGSFLTGLVAGVIILILLALSLPPQSELRTNNQLRKTTEQLQVSATQSVRKIRLQIQGDLAAFQKGTLLPISRWFSQGWKGVAALLHTNTPSCGWLTWLDQARIGFLNLLGVHPQPWNFLGCTLK